ncbi:MAG: histidine--tRNA ligase [Deltaproteobacteria bacterium]|nr:histidine--tRNA ligase [Deltaproteobacteria bacterium]
MTIQAVRGMKDVMAPEVGKWQFIEATARRIFGAFGFHEIKTPILEKTELFQRSLGETTDIVEKEMYTFADRGGENLTMRPEATAGVLRAFIENKLYGQPGPHKLFTIGPMFRRERPQKGRFRQFHQLNAEVLGDGGPLMDAELLVMLTQLLSELGLAEVSLVLNSLGCPNPDCRPAFRQALLDYFLPQKDRLCEDCRRRLTANPLRVLDCKVEGCREAAQGAPQISAHWCGECREHYDKVKDYLTLAGVVFREDPGLVRGLDYYRRTTFEAIAGGLGAQNAVAGGGRYDGLVEELGGPPTQAIGFAAGLERLALLLPDDPAHNPGPALFLAALGEVARRWAFGLAQELRRAGRSVEMMSEDKSLKAQMRRANKLAARRVLIVGEAEMASGRAVLKDMGEGGQEEIPLAEAASRLAGLTA